MVEWERDARHSAGLSLVRIAIWSVTEIEIRKGTDREQDDRPKQKVEEHVPCPRRRGREREANVGTRYSHFYGTTTPPIPMESCVVITRDEHGTLPHCRRRRLSRKRPERTVLARILEEGVIVAQRICGCAGR
ncbi:hypothetical protein EVAR_103202_1 [Eumeta japonica]|uniref:Uncharacterized protein n=1 Tax=Eumeta variegata TaxID=151549 RepID=A0A4C1YGH6_EUMVA|nr:hypothetical protein EVAR_103202_1 [Eumeta japonica]